MSLSTRMEGANGEAAMATARRSACSRAATRSGLSRRLTPGTAEDRRGRSGMRSPPTSTLAILDGEGLASLRLWRRSANSGSRGSAITWRALGLASGLSPPRCCRLLPASPKPASGLASPRSSAANSCRPLPRRRMARSVSAQVRDHPEHVSTLMATFLLHVYPKMKGANGREWAKPRSAFAYVLALIRIFRRWKVLLPAASQPLAARDGVAKGVTVP